MTRADRIDQAVTVALEHGRTNGAHHKMWVIDQMLRALLGDRYEQVIRNICSWDEGIAP